MIDEIWKDIKDFKGLYQVSNFGRVRSLGHDKWHKGRVLKPHLDGKGCYLMVGLHKESKTQHFNIHRLVACAFIPNPKHLPQVNHKDECKTNNCADNLEWCTNQYNINYNNGAAMKRAIKTRYERYDVKELVAKTKSTKIANNSYSAERPVNQFTWDGAFVNRYPSAIAAMRETGIQMHVIAKSCKGKYKQAGGFVWLYDEDVKKISQRTLDAHPNSKKVCQIDFSGNIVRVWNSAKEACETLHINPASLSECCHGKRKKTKGFIWKFLKD
jgi:hypothetical protein